jgi:hypothetical protein
MMTGFLVPEVPMIAAGPIPVAVAAHQAGPIPVAVAEECHPGGPIPAVELAHHQE